MEKRIATKHVVIGAGITGLSCAYKLISKNQEVILVDPSQIGGMIQTSHADGFTLEHGPNVLLLKPHFLNFLQETGLSDSIIKPAIKDYQQMVWHAGSARVVPRSFSAFLLSGLFPLRSKFQIISRIFKTDILKPEEDDESIEIFLSRLVGQEVCDRIVDPVLKGIYGSDIRLLSAKTIFGELWTHALSGKPLTQYFRQKKAQGGSPEVCVLKGGNDSLIKKLQQVILNKSSIINDSVKLIEKSGGWRLVLDSGTEVLAESVWVSTGASSSARFLANSGNFELKSLAQMLATVRSSGLISSQFSSKSLPSKYQKSFGVLFPRDTKRSLLGVMFNSRIFPHMAPADRELLTVVSGSSDKFDQLSNKSDDLLLSEAKESLREFVGPAEYIELSIKRWPEAVPLYKVGHQVIVKALRETENKFSGLKFIGTDNGGVGVSDRVKTAMLAIQEYENILTPKEEEVRYA